MPDSRVLVVGTTPDYIAHIHEHYPGRALFLTDLPQREKSPELAPDSVSEIVCRLGERDNAMSALHDHLGTQHQNLSGAACFDCEWLTLAAELAGHFRLPFPSVQSVRLSRDKYLTKKAWAEHGVRCPSVEQVHSVAQALTLVERLGGPIVLKPSCGSGSELTFRCDNAYELAVAYRTLTDGLISRKGSPLYRADPGAPDDSRIKPAVLAEEFIEGREYSADFIVAGGEIHLIRVSKKLRGNGLPFGTTSAYVVPAELPGGVNYEALAEKLREAAAALGFRRAICMVDFIISNGEVIFLELTPRIGGDCLPPVIRRSCGLDTIGLALDFAEGHNIITPSLDQWRQHVGLRLFSPRGGVLSGWSCNEASEDSRVKEINIQRAPGYKITMPPEDYDSWLLGHVIFEPHPGVCLRKQCNDIREKFVVNVESHYEHKLDSIHDASCRTVHPESRTA